MATRRVIHHLQNRRINFNRFLSSASRRPVRNHHNLKFLPEEELAPMMAYFPKFIEDATGKDILLGNAKVNDRFERYVKHMLPTGKLLRLHTLIYVYKFIEKHYGSETPDEEKMEKVYQMCWCLEAHNNTYITVDDMMDSNDTRRGIKTWANLVGGGAANDALLLEYVLLRLLKKYFKDHPNYDKIVETYLEPHCPISMALELEFYRFEDYTMENLKLLAAWKMMRHNYNHPIELATLLADKAYFMNDLIKKALIHIGFLFSVQNDIADCYGNDVTGKKCVDIQDKRCCLPIVIALQKASPSQRKILEENYGYKDERKINKVKEMYQELKILDEYYKIEEEYLQKISEEIHNIPDDLTRSLMWKIAYVNTYGQVGEPPQ